MVDKSRQIDYRGLDLLVDSINGEAPGGGEVPEVSWDDVTDKPVVIAAGADAAAARTAIGAGTSSLVIGTSASQAAAGNHTHTFTALTGAVSGATGANLQAILEDIVTRLAAAETP